jgi:dCMP deaminase
VAVNKNELVIIQQSLSWIVVILVLLSQKIEGCKKTPTDVRGIAMQDSAICSSTPVNKRLLPALNKEETPKRIKPTLEASTQQTPLANVLPSINDKGVVVTPKRQGYLSWDDYFIVVAILSSKRSKDPRSPSGACIVDDQNHVVGIGYNGFPRGCPDDVFPWREADNKTELLHTKDPYVCHAVTNAILNKCSDNVAKCRVYVMVYPNSDSAKVIIQSRIEEVVILQTNDEKEDEDDIDTQASRILLGMAGVTVRYYKPSFSSVTLDFVSALTPTTWTPSEKETPEAMSECFKKEMDAKEEACKLLLKEANYDASKVEDNGKRTDYISWHDYFMAMAFLTAQRSKDPNTQVGACIVDSEKRIVGLGYNGFPRGCSDDHLPWARCNTNKLHNKYLYVCHAEVNAILNKGSADVKGASIYVALFPCENCAKMIIQAGIQEVVYMSDSYHNTDGCRASRIMLQCAKVKLRHYIPTMQTMVLDF